MSTSSDLVKSRRSFAQSGLLAAASSAKGLRLEPVEATQPAHFDTVASATCSMSDAVIEPVEITGVNKAMHFSLTPKSPEKSGKVPDFWETFQLI